MRLAWICSGLKNFDQYQSKDSLIYGRLLLFVEAPI